MSEEAPMICDRCGRPAEDTFWARTRSRLMALCPGCIADLRNRGDTVKTASRVEPRPWR